MANRLARVAASEEAASALRELKMSRVFASQENGGSTRIADAQRQNPLPSQDDCRYIGIWEKQSDSGHFVRRTDMFNEWHLWANVGRIPVKRAKRRVVLIGESVARGYLFDPQFTPAKALESILVSQLGRAEVDIVDLARTNMHLEQMSALAQAALRLQPDVVIVFAGNNWLRDRFRNTDVPELAAAVRESGIAGLKCVMEANYKESIGNVVRDIRTLYEANRVPLVWIMPEFNLRDWRDPGTNAPCLPDGGNWEWLEQCANARRALANRDFVKASDCAGKMVELDQGTSATGFYILAACSQSIGDVEQTRSHLESARDALIWSPFVKTPRPYTITHKTLREELMKDGENLVDLPQLFHAHAGAIPDRRLFLDYCHLTAEGIQVAMAAAASRVLRLFTGVTFPWRTLARQSAAPAQRVEAEAMFLAAIHNAHWRQPYELVRYFCGRALELSPDLANAMPHLIDIQTRRTPELMCKSAERIVELPFPTIRQYLLRLNYRQFDRVLLDAVVDSLAAIGVDRRAHLDKLRIEERSVARCPVELVDPYYAFSCEQQLAQPGVLIEKMPFEVIQADYYKAYSPESKFVFVGESGVALSLVLTCRLPVGATEEGSVSVELNDRSIVEAPIGTEWQSWEIAVPVGAVKSGINEVVVRWPLQDFRGIEQLEAAADDLLAGFLPEFYPVFGEIHSFTVSRRVPVGAANV